MNKLFLMFFSLFPSQTNRSRVFILRKKNLKEKYVKNLRETKKEN